MNAPQHAGVVAPPPLIFGTALTAGLLLDWLAGTSTGLDRGVRFGCALLLFGPAALLLASALTGFRGAGTHPAPWRPTTAIVSSGAYRYTRNPMYLGMALLHAALGLAANAPTAILFVAPALLVIHYGVVLREERYLEAVFGEDYRRYRAAVRRWL